MSLVLSSLSSSTPPPIIDLFRDRISSSIHATTSTISTTSASLRRRLVCCSTSNLKSMPDSIPLSSSSVDIRRHNPLLFPHSSLLHLRSAQELLSRLKKESEYGRLPENVASALEELYENYRNAVFSSEHPNAEEIFLSNMSAMLDCVIFDMEDPFIFPPYHKAVREPYDYYAFGQNYIRPLIDFRSSYVGNIAIFREMEEKRQQGHNIILMSNHQTEADPAVIALLLEGTNPEIAENMTYVAGDRVVTDPLCKPFSMGRNLLCVYSKKHMYDVPELVDFKKRANTRTLKEMALLLRGGSQVIWIAPSGGRDRPDPVTKEWYPAPFDISSVDNMRRLVKHAGVPGHIYPLSILCYDIMPPPPQVEKEIGEKRLVSFHGVGLSVTPEVNYHDIALHCRNEGEVKSTYAHVLHDSVNEQYKVLKAAIHGKQGLEASTPALSLLQPWRSN
ncbi:glycerol-3-phosphate acyltransferase, chloroplastic-like isoform X2 [Silene latifolia]|uniref:glycerol-3-phosphate acyltransferase, chloroplastic-like isoform X2 n=1 Tax=Silene latifolia TaxID=37657 RepID=UPI003D7742F6